MAWEHDIAPSATSLTAKTAKPKIALCLPYTEALSPEFVEKVWGPLRWIPLEWCDKIPFMCKTQSLPMARNILSQQALDANCTHLLWVDSDSVIENPPDANQALKMLYQCDAAISACLYRAKQKQGFNYAAWKKQGDGYTPIQSWTGNWFPVDVTGLHFCLIKREVFEKVSKPYFHWEEDTAVSEDFYFFEKAKQVGYDVWIFSEVRLSHLGALKVLSNGKVTTRDV